MSHSLPLMRSFRLVAGGVLVLIGLVLYGALLDDLPTLVHDAGDRRENLVELWGSRTIGQTLQAPTTNISGVDLLLQTPKGQRLQGTITLHVRRTPDDQENLRSAAVEAKSLRRSAYTPFRFAPLPTDPGDTLFLALDYPTGTAEKPLLVRVEQPRPDDELLSDYPGGAVTIAGTPAEGDLAFRILARSRLPFGVQVAAGVVLCGTTLLCGGLFPRRSTVVSAVMLGVGLPMIFLLPMLKNLSYLGVGDWDMNTTRFTAANRALLQEQSFPGWNPYLCGGTPLAGFPESRVFSPFVGTVLLGGPVMGFKVNILLHGIFGFLGMLVWLRRGWRTSWLAAFLGAAVVCFSSFVALHLSEGHTRKIAIAWIPWVFYFLQRASSGETGSLRFAAPAGVALALLPLDGSVYLSIYTVVGVVLISALTSLQRRTWAPLRAGIWTLLISGLLAGVHLIPSAASQAVLHPALEAPTAGLPLRSSIDMFLDPNQDPNAVKFSGQTQRWVEYGAYVGIAPVVLAVFGTLAGWRRLWPWAALGAFFFLGAFSPQMQSVLDHVPALGSLRNPQRMAVMVTVVAGLAAAFGLDRILQGLSRSSSQTPALPEAPRAAAWALAVLTALVIGQLIFVNTETLAQTFVIPPPAAADEQFQQGWAPRRDVGTDDSFPFTMANTARNRGSINRCSVAAVRPGNLRLPSPEPGGEVAAEFVDELYTGEAFLLTGTGTATVVSQKTSEVVMTYSTETEATVVINQNYHPGWVVDVAASGSPAERRAAENARGLAATRVSPGRGTLTFTYLPPGLGAGLAASGGGLLLAFWRWKKK